jgi:DNA replicative helicase MCM subunit Mcm2 (Cdc46/Mcm family)
MARTHLSLLEFRVYEASGELIGATMHADDALVLIAALDAGATIRARGGRVLWDDGDSVDTRDRSALHRAALTIYRRLAKT